MTFRNLTRQHDWTFGSGISNYAAGQEEIAVNIKTRVLSFLGDCFFATNEGVDYWNLLDYNGQEELEKQITDTILTTPGVERVDNAEILRSANRVLNLSYSVYTIYSTTINNSIPLISRI